jgi:hypothetical protein
MANQRPFRPASPYRLLASHPSFERSPRSTSLMSRLAVLGFCTSERVSVPVLPLGAATTVSHRTTCLYLPNGQ